MHYMVDFHSHILPGIDDGSQNVEESLQMLDMLAFQGAKKVVATPHFMATETAPQEFFIKRQNSYNQLKEKLSENHPEIVLGAEVLYYSGISRMQELSSFCIDGTQLLLLEMPTKKWNDYIVREVLELNCTGDITVVLAHIERYLPFMEEGVLERLVENDVLMQVNANFFLRFATRHKAIKMLKNDYIQLIGSDCHDIKYRPPRLDEAYKVIKNRMGEAFVGYFQERSERFLEGLM